MIDKWGRLGIARTWAAIAVYGLFVADVALR
jgi:hypothetical protein